ncbi:MAG TPA: hypothetical protein VFV00_05060 [Acidimicrobiales bacterium]|nr:hypothetical protein [Acidimicrobiales bacterium]
MTHIVMRCAECGGKVVFGEDDRSSSGLGVLARCDCGSGYRLSGGILSTIPTPAALAAAASGELR